MIRHLCLRDVGPARELKFDFAPRLNVLTGDNGLGKTFVLDALWWAITTTWAGQKAFPWRPVDGSTSGSRSGPHARSTSGSRSGPHARSTSGDGSGRGDEASDARIIAEVATSMPGDPDVARLEVRGRFEWGNQEWSRSDSWARGLTKAEPDTPRPPSASGLVVYARIDGSYAIWDAHYANGGVESFSEAAIVLTDSELWDGKDVSDHEVAGGRRKVIGGLIADWVNWQQRAKSPEFEALRRVLHALSSPDEPLVPAEPTRVHLRDRRDIPTLATSYGVVPVTLASAGVRRALSLAYLLVWAWAEHKKAAKESRRSTTRDVVLLIDEPELHLHPAWQRVFLPAVLRAVGMVAPNAAVQVFTATHSPMVLASLESVFREKSDDLFVLERDGSVVRANELPFGKEGDVSNWLASEVFGGVGGRSREAQLAIAAAMDFMADRTSDAEENLRALLHRLGELRASPTPSQPDDRSPLVERIHDALRQTLAGGDDFWVQWVLTYDQARQDGSVSR